MPISKPVTLFGPGLGGPSENYRIPSMVVTKRGTVVACADARFFTGADNPNRIDKVIRRSEDCGETWGGFILAVQEYGESKESASSAVDPVMVYDEQIDRIYMLYCHTPAGIGILNCSCTRGEDELKGKLLFRGRKKYYLRKGKIYTEGGEKTPYTADEDGTVYKDGERLCNFKGREEFREAPTSYLMICHSDDDGLTWSEPRSLNLQVKREYMSFIGPGPGVGIVVKAGKYKGRIVVPIYYGAKKFPLSLSCTCIYSDDNGESWKMGVSPNNTRKVGFFPLKDKLVFEPFMLTESQIIELPDGTLRCFMRNHSKKRRVAVAESYDGGVTWKNFRFNEQLNQPICQLSVIRLEEGDKKTVVFLNPASEGKRANGTVRLSFDGGETFPYSRVLKADDFVYSCLAELPDGTIGALYEPHLLGEKIDFVKFTLDWIKGEE